MKKVLISMAIISVVFVMGMKKQIQSELSEEQTAAIQKEVLKSHREMIETIEKLDVDTFFESIIESGQGTIIRNGRVMTRQESLKRTKSGFVGIKKCKYEFTQKFVKVLSPQTAIFIGQGKSTVTLDTGEMFNTDFAVTSVFVLKDDKWKIFHGHHSVPNHR